jgi:NAD(P)-dependent dehydrogenase (short-subunit alcohol dehydrogenase family)
MSTVLVTGGSSGLGLAIVKRLAQSGDQVFAASRHPEPLELPAGAVPVVLDLTDPMAADHVVQQVIEAAGTLDVLVNNAGSHVMSPIEETDEADLRNIFEVNLFGSLRLAVAAIPLMRNQGGGRIINVTSISDIMPTPFSGWYSAAKAALASASAVLNAEVRAFGIRVTVVAPGLFRTKMAQALGSYQVLDASPYRDVFRAYTAREREEMWPKAANPDDFAEVVERCIRDPEPPARIAVGQDAEAMEQLVRTKTGDEYAELLHKFMERLDASASRGSASS